MSELNQIKIPLSPARDWLFDQAAPKQMRVWIYGAGSSHHLMSVQSSPCKVGTVLLYFLGRR